MEQVGYTQSHKVFYFQVDGNGIMTPTALLSDLQEVAINHSEFLGYSVNFLAEKKLGWVIINYHLDITRMPKFGEMISIQTWCVKCQKMQNIRCFYILDENKEIIVKAMTRWVFMNLETRKPINIPEEMAQCYRTDLPPAIDGEKFLMPRVVECEGSTSRLLVITRRDTDSNGHANNVKYLEWAMDDVPDEIYDTMQIKDIRIVYRKECVRGDEVTMNTHIHELDHAKEAVTFIMDQAKTVLAEVVTLWH